MRYMETLHNCCEARLMIVMQTDLWSFFAVMYECIKNIRVRKNVCMGSMQILSPEVRSLALAAVVKPFLSFVPACLVCCSSAMVSVQFSSVSS